MLQRFCRYHSTGLMQSGNAPPWHTLQNASVLRRMVAALTTALGM